MDKIYAKYTAGATSYSYKQKYSDYRCGDYIYVSLDICLQVFGTTRRVVSYTSAYVLY